MAKQKRKINVIVTFSEGWQERFTKAAYELWLKCKQDELRRKEPSYETENI